ncbi:MAG: flagellar basal-body MS-ring/collar protein FliF, partial [bacterium]
MAEQAGVLGDVRLQFQDFFGSLSIAKRVTVLVSLLIVLVGMVSIIIISNQDSWAPLYSNLETQDAARIVQKLQENQIPYLLGPGGNSVMVHPEMADQARLTLASEKVLPGGGIGFLDLFEQPALGETEFQQQVKYRIAQEGELARLIGMIESIDRAKVSLAVPQKTLFSDSQEEASASVALTVKTQGISEKQVETVVHLVAGAVEGLEPRRVRVTDQKGRLLTEGMDDQTVGGRLDEHYSYKRRLEMELEQKVIAQLEEVVGEDRVRVNVNAVLQFDRETIREQLIDPDQTSVVSEQLVDEASTGTRSIPVGPAGVTTNLPEATGREAATVSEFAKKNSTRNYETSRREIVKETASGQVLRLTVSVLLDNKRPQILDEGGNYIGRDNIPWSENEKEEIQSLVRNAIGFNEARGDRVSVVNMPFGKAVEEDKAAELEATRVRNQFILDLIRYVALGAAVLALKGRPWRKK